MRRTTPSLLLSCLALLWIAALADAKSIKVPADQPTIQAAINASINGDTILVSPGTYVENPDYSGKSIRLLGRGGADSTDLIPDAPATNSVRISAGSGPGTELAGFTLRGGTAKHVVEILGGATPWIHHNIFRDNVSYVYNAAEIGCFGSNPTIERNLFIHNRSLGGVGVFSGTATILNNTFSDNSRAFWSQGTGVVAKNNIVANSVQFGIGGVGYASANYNCVFNNHADYSIGAVPGFNDVHVDPVFVNLQLDDYALEWMSPCVDGGDPGMQYNDPDSTRNDIGAYWFPHAPGDADRDGIPDSLDNCPFVANNTQFDTDGDALGDACDICPDAFDPTQEDLDGDHIGDACDACPDDASNDFDGDGLCGVADNCPFIPNADQADLDGDGIGDVCGNSVWIESKVTTVGQSYVEVDVYVSNIEPMRAFVLPLEVRSVTPGAYVSGSFDLAYMGWHPSSSTASEKTVMGMSDTIPAEPLRWDEMVEIMRTAKGGDEAMWAQNRPTPEPFNPCSGPLSSSFGTIAPLDFVSPDAVFDVLTTTLPKGVDRRPSFRITFAVTNVYGSFEIDTCCAMPANHIGFVPVDVTELITPEFTKGVVTIGCPGCCLADPMCDGVHSDVVDVVTVIGNAFRAIPAIRGPGCPAAQSDVDCSGNIDIVDVVKVVDVAFRAAEPVVKYCHPCQM